MDIRKVTLPSGRYYEIDQRRYPSITTVLSAGNEKNPVLEAWRERVGEAEANRISKESTDIGTAMHACFEFYLKGLPLPEMVTEEEKKGYQMFKASKPLIDSFVKEVIAQEKIVWSDVLKVAGQFDLLCKNRKGEVVLVDFKSTKRFKTKAQAEGYRIQTAFYRHCIKETMGIDPHHASLFFVNREGEARWMRFENDDTPFVELVDLRMAFAEMKGW